MWVSLTLPWVPEVFLAYGGNFRCWPKADTSSPVGRSYGGEAARNIFRAGHYKDLTETGNRARKVAGIQGTLTCDKLRLRISNPIQTDSMFWID